MKKIALLTLALVLALPLAACGGGTEQSPAASQPAESSEPTQPSEPTQSSEPTQAPRVIPDFPVDKEPVLDKDTANAQIELARQGTLEEKKALARGDKLSLPVLLDLVRSKDMDNELAAILAGRIKARSGIDANMYQGLATAFENPLFRQALAENPNVTQEALVILLSDADAQVKAAATAAHEKLYGPVQ